MLEDDYSVNSAQLALLLGLRNQRYGMGILTAFLGPDRGRTNVIRRSQVDAIVRSIPGLQIVRELTTEEREPLRYPFPQHVVHNTISLRCWDSLPKWLGLVGPKGAGASKQFNTLEEAISWVGEQLDEPESEDVVAPETEADVTDEEAMMALNTLFIYLMQDN